MNKIKRDNFNNEKKNMSNSNISYELNNNPLNIVQNIPLKNNLQEIIKIPKNIGPYEIISKLKDGCYSKIYLAKSKYTGDNVCVKIIDKISFQENAEDLLLATRQIETLKILKHRNILSLLEIYESPKFIFLITEYLSGKDLIEHLIIKKRFSEAEAQKLFFQLVDALYYMHKMNICHRDIRTEHIIFDKNNTPKIIGFSYSTFYTKKQKLKDSFGSLCYACPEIIQENSYDPELADIWSLGVVLYVMVCGYLPFSEENDEKNKDLILKGKVEFPAEMSSKLKDLLRHMLDTNSSKRYNFIRIMKHPWFKPFNEELLIGGCNLYKMIYPVDEKILNIMQIFGFNKNDIENDMRNNKFNIGTGLFRHLVTKLNEMGFKSVSNLGCKDYLLYKNNKNNYYEDNEIRYNNYLNLVQEKIEKIEKLISDYQEKEENIIQQLNNFEEVNLSMMKNDKSIYKNDNDNDNNSDSNSMIYLNDNNSEKDENNKNTKNKTSKKMCHRRTLTPMFAFKELDETEMNTEIGHINKEELEFITKSKKSEKRKNTVLNKNMQLKFNIKENNNTNNIKLYHSKSCPLKKNVIRKILNKMRNSYKNKNSKNADITRRIDDTHNITASYTKWQDTSMVIRRKKNYLNSSSFLDGYLKRPHPDNLRKNDVKNSLLNDINQIIIEENNNSIINNSGNMSNNNINYEIRRTKQIRYSLSFGDDDEDEEDENESSYISKIDSKQVSIYDIDEELKVLKEIGNNIKSPYLKARNGNNNNNQSNVNKLVSNFNDKNQNNFLFNSSKNINNNIRNSNKFNNIQKTNTTKNQESPIIFNSNQAEMSFHEDTNIKNATIKSNFSNNISNAIIRSNSTNESNNNIMNNNKLNKNDNEKDIDNNPIYKASTYVVKKKEEKKEINTFYIDKKKISKLNISNNNEQFLFINYINKKEKNKYAYSYFKDIFTIKKLQFADQNCPCSISEIEKYRPNKEKHLKKKEKEKEKDKDKDKDKEKYFNRNSNIKFSQRKTFEANKTKKDKNVVIIENNNTTRKNYHNSKELFFNSGYAKNNNLKNNTNHKNNNINNNDLTEKKNKKRESIEAKNIFLDNNNIVSGLEKGSNKKLNKNIKYQNNVNNNNNNKTKEKNKIKNLKFPKSKYKSDISNKFHEELNFTNISDLSEIKALSILSAGYINTNVENKYQNIYDNKENILFSNILSNKLNYISFDKSFQSQSQSQNQNQNKSRYHMSNLSVSHENNIICKGICKADKEKEKNKNNSSMNHFNINNKNKKIKRNVDNSSSNINFEELSINSSSNIFSNYENFSHKINNYNESFSNIDYMNKNSYNNNYIVTIKKRNLAEKLKEEIQKSINKNNFNSPPFITNGRVNIANDNKELNNNNLNNPLFNGNAPQSNGKKIREKIMRCSSMLNKNNIIDNNPISKNSNTLVNNYNNNIPIRHHDLNQSQYVTQYININNTNTNINKSINVNSLSSINNQTEQFFGNYDNNNIKTKDNNIDMFLSDLQMDNKIEEYDKPKRKTTIKIKKKLSNSVTYETTERNNSVNHIICVSKSKKKSNGKKKYLINNNKNNNNNNNIDYNNYNDTITTNLNNKKSKNLLKNVKYKCLNGKAKINDLNNINNNNVILLSKHKKNYDYTNYPDKFITCSVPDLNDFYHKNNKNNNNINSGNKSHKKILSDYMLPKNKNNNKSINKKSSFNKNNNEAINNKYKKKNSVNNNIYFDFNNTKRIKNKSLYKKNNHITHRSSMNLFDNLGK